MKSDGEGSLPRRGVVFHSAWHISTSSQQCCSSTILDSSTATMSEHAGNAAAGVGLDDDFLADPTEEREEVFPGVRLEGEQGKCKDH